MKWWWLLLLLPFPVIVLHCLKAETSEWTNGGVEEQLVTCCQGGNGRKSTVNTRSSRRTSDWLEKLFSRCLFLFQTNHSSQQQWGHPLFWLQTGIPKQSWACWCLAAALCVFTGVWTIMDGHEWEFVNWTVSVVHLPEKWEQEGFEPDRRVALTGNYWGCLDTVRPSQRMNLFINYTACFKKKKSTESPDVSLVINQHVFQ